MSNRTIILEAPSTDALNGVPNNSQNGEMSNSSSTSTSHNTYRSKGAEYNTETHSKYDSNSSSGDGIMPPVTGSAVRKETTQAVKHETTSIETHKESEESSDVLIFPAIILACLVIGFMKMVNKVGNALDSGHNGHGGHSKHRHH